MHHVLLRNYLLKEKCSPQKFVVKNWEGIGKSRTYKLKVTEKKWYLQIKEGRVFQDD